MTEFWESSFIEMQSMWGFEPSNSAILSKDFFLKNEVKDILIPGIGYHYTRAIPNDFKEKGMLIRGESMIRDEFKKNHFHLFSQEEQIQIIKAWSESFGEDDIKIRDNRIFFNFILSALNWGTADLLLKYYGGEQVYAPIYLLPGIGEKLNKIGEPLVLKCVLNPNNIRTYIENPWGKIIVSSYHRTKNNEAQTIDQDGNQKVEIKPENIEIIKLKKHYRQ